MKFNIKCIKCGDKATKVIEEVEVKIPLCDRHYTEFVDEEDSFIDNVLILEEEYGINKT